MSPEAKVRADPMQRVSDLRQRLRAAETTATTATANRRAAEQKLKEAKESLHALDFKPGPKLEGELDDLATALEGQMNDVEARLGVASTAMEQAE